MKSSLPFQLLLHLGSYYLACFLGIELLLLIYKSIILPYKSFTLFSEVNNWIRTCHVYFFSCWPTHSLQFFLLITMGVIETCRMFSGWKGNLTESKASIGISLVLIVPAVLSSVYILAFQSYVLRFMDNFMLEHYQSFLFSRLEVILSSIYLSIQGLQLIFGLICAATFYKGG